MAIKNVACRGFGFTGGTKFIPTHGYSSLIPVLGQPVFGAGAVYLPGAQAGDGYLPGAQQGAVYRPGAQAGGEEGP